jgi:hypothetical protein
MAEADRMADMPTGHDDVGHVQPKTLGDDEEGEGEETDSE